MSSADEYLMESVLMYLNRNRNNTQTDTTRLLEENRELRIMLQELNTHSQKMRSSWTQLVSENEKLRANYQALKKSADELIESIKSKYEINEEIINQLTESNYPKVSQPNNVMTRRARILKFRKSIFQQNNIDPNNIKQIETLPINTKRLINLHVMAFGELLALPEIVAEYIVSTQTKSFGNLSNEADILSAALTLDNNAQIPALQGWGYLQMMQGVSVSILSYIKEMQEVLSDEDKANTWLSNRVSELVNSCEFIEDFTLPQPTSIPPPLAQWESSMDRLVASKTTEYNEMSSNRTEYTFNIMNKSAYPNTAIGTELVKGPVLYELDCALIWGVSLSLDNAQDSRENNIRNTLVGQRVPTLLNRAINANLQMPPSERSIEISLLTEYGI